MYLRTHSALAEALMEADVLADSLALAGSTCDADVLADSLALVDALMEALVLPDLRSHPLKHSPRR